jgi:hypothetical protein
MGEADTMDLSLEMSTETIVMVTVPVVLFGDGVGYGLSRHWQS